MKVGRRRVTDRPEFDGRFKSILERWQYGDLSLGKAAKELGVGKATFFRLVHGQHVSQGETGAK